jgi:hypothetical protein
MPNNETEPGRNPTEAANADDTLGGGGGGHAALGGGGKQVEPGRASFVGFIFPSPLDENGQLKNQPLSKGLGRAHLVAVVYPYDPNSEGQAQHHAELDKKLGQPFFTAYIYPNPFLDKDVEGTVASIGGGGGGKSVLGGVAATPIYLGQFHATLPDDGEPENNSVPAVAPPQV